MEAFVHQAALAFGLTPVERRHVGAAAQQLFSEHMLEVSLHHPDQLESEFARIYEPLSTREMDALNYVIELAQDYRQRHAATQLRH